MKMKIFDKTKKLSSNDILPNNSDPVFRQIWNHNGNQLSNVYVGTDAMKGDFTLTGKRTIYGLLNDAKISVNRYFINNFKDGYY